MTKKPSYRLPIKLLVTALLVCFVTSVAIMSPVGDGGRAIQFEILPGSGGYAISQKLKELKLIHHSRFFRFYLQLLGHSSSIHVGVYELNDSMWMPEIISSIASGKVKLYPLTIVEGWNNRQIGDYLTEKGLVKNREEFLEISSNQSILKKYKIKGASTEGYLLPETYMIPKGYSAKYFHELMLQYFFRELKKITGGISFPVQKIHERIILASIVEREAQHAKERRVIARVFLNRIEKRMRLESCATVQYLFPKPKKKLYLQDLEKPSPYNTYIHYGFPPGPISNPGRASLKAVFDPEQNKYLYFVVKPDRSHHFSENYAGHLKAKERYIDSSLLAK